MGIAKLQIFVFQGNAATHLRCGGWPNIGFVGNLLFCSSERIL